PYHTYHHYNLLFSTDPASPNIYTLSLHDALPIFEDVGIFGLEDKQAYVICARICHDGNITGVLVALFHAFLFLHWVSHGPYQALDRKSTRLNSSHVAISYAVFCLKKKKTSP